MILLNFATAFYVNAEVLMMAWMAHGSIMKNGYYHMRMDAKPREVKFTALVSKH